MKKFNTDGRKTKTIVPSNLSSISNLKLIKKIVKWQAMRKTNKIFAGALSAILTCELEIL